MTLRFIYTFLILILLFSSCLNQCTNISPSIIMDCSTASTIDNSCCFYKSNNKSYCTWWGTKFRGTMTKPDGITYHCDNPKGSSCGKDNPLSVNECNSYSASTNTCCYYKSFSGEIGCQWWGSYLKGTVDYNGRSLECESSHIKINGKSVFIFILVILNIFI
jgi:hypothetical protein